MDEYDSLMLIMNELENYKEYTAFSSVTESGKCREYNLMMDETATGLLKDVAVSTRVLDTKQREKHEYALNVFAAYCMHHCVKNLIDKFGKNGIVMNDAPRIAENIYFKIQNRLKQDFKEGREFHHVKAMIRTAANWGSVDVIRKMSFKDGNGSWTPKEIPLETESEEDGEQLLNKEVVAQIMEGVAVYIRNEHWLDVLSRIVKRCHDSGADRREKLSDREMEILCRVYNLGDGFGTQLNQTDLAVELGKSKAYVSKQLKTATKKLVTYIQQHEDLKRELHDAIA